jgi:hypothetical protein
MKVTPTMPADFRVGDEELVLRTVAAVVLAEDREEQRPE